ncbi:MAG TPA: hypothetical protein VGF13_18710, partial [Verrucomicrobiae bacterium]
MKQKQAAWIFLATALLVARNSPAQTPVEVPAVLRASPTTAARKTNEPAAASTMMAPELSNAIHAVNFDRSPEALFDAVRTQQAGGKLSESERFRLAVLLGDWGHVSTALKTLTDEDSMKAYSRLLESLATNSQSAAQFFQQQQQSRGSAGVTYDQYGNPIPGTPASTVSRRAPFLNDDFYAVLDAAPADLTASHLPYVTMLVNVAIGAGGKQDFLGRLEKGLKGIGGSTSSGKKLAAQLLSSANWMTDAAPYLPLKREEWENSDTLTLVLTLEYFTQTGVEKRDERQLKRAAELCAFMMQTSR